MLSKLFFFESLEKGQESESLQKKFSFDSENHCFNQLNEKSHTHHEETINLYTEYYVRSYFKKITQLSLDISPYVYTLEKF